MNGISFQSENFLEFAFQQIDIIFLMNKLIFKFIFRKFIYKKNKPLRKISYILFSGAHLILFLVLFLHICIVILIA